MSVQKYAAAQRTTDNPRNNEYRLLAQVTRELMECKNQPMPKRMEVLDWNRRIWLTLQTDLADPRNQLPNQLKATLISLAIWVVKYTRKVTTGAAPIEPLITVNRNIMEGLAGGAAAAQRPANRNAA